MGRKRQEEPNQLNDSSDSHDENQNTSECIHVKKAVNLHLVKKGLDKTGFAMECEECKKDPIEKSLEMNGDFEFDASLWLCLRCGNQACGRYRNEHALKHYKTTHSDCHSICVNTSAWNLWCYDCDIEINASCKKKLLECVEYLKKHFDSNKLKQDSFIPLIDNKVRLYYTYIAK